MNLLAVSVAPALVLLFVTMVRGDGYGGYDSYGGYGGFYGGYGGGYGVYGGGHGGGYGKSGKAVYIPYPHPVPVYPRYIPVTYNNRNNDVGIFGMLISLVLLMSLFGDNNRYYGDRHSKHH